MLKAGDDNSFDVTKCLQQIKIPKLLYMFAPCSEQPSNISTMDNSKPGEKIRFVDRTQHGTHIGG